MLEAITDGKGLHPPPLRDGLTAVTVQLTPPSAPSAFFLISSRPFPPLLTHQGSQTAESEARSSLQLGAMDKQRDSGNRLAGVGLLLRPWLAPCPWVSYTASLHLLPHLPMQRQTPLRTTVRKRSLELPMVSTTKLCLFKLSQQFTLRTFHRKIQISDFS